MRTSTPLLTGLLLVNFGGFLSLTSEGLGFVPQLGRAAMFLGLLVGLAGAAYAVVLNTG